MAANLFNYDQIGLAVALGLLGLVCGAAIGVMAVRYLGKSGTRDKDLKTKTAELERMNRLMIGRELRIIDLKHELVETHKLAGLPPQSADKPVVPLDKLRIGVEDTEKAMLNILEDLNQAKSLAEREEAKGAAILASIGEGLLVTDRQGAVTVVNAAAETITQWTKQDLIGKSIVDTMRLKAQSETGSIVPASESPFLKVLQSGQAVSSKAIGTDTYYLIRKDQTSFPLAMTAAPVVANGQVIGSVLIFSDATHERQVDRMKTEFISLASHQLRTPLSAIKWFNEMLLSGDAGKLTPEQEEFAKNVADSTERMIDLVNSLLNISRIESGRIIVDPKPTDLNQLVSGIVNDLKAKIEGRQQTLIVSVHKELPAVNLDPRMISQVYLNLLTNAIKYTPKGGEISVFVSRRGDELVSQITDNGYGIPKAEQGKMFQKFFRATNVSRVETDGTGLGLYLIKTIIESSGGNIWFESQEGKGTTFWFSLPMSGMKAKKGEVVIEEPRR